MMIKLFEEFNLTEIEEMLKKWKVPYEMWGTGKSKTLKHLQNELDEEECSLVETSDKLIRLIEFVGIKIYFKKDGETFFLKEERQEFNDGRIRRRNIPSSVSEKMKFGEDPLIAAIRGIREELGVKIMGHQLTKQSDLHYDSGSLSYPGLETKYKGHKFICHFNDEQYDPKGYVEIQEDKKTFFSWVKL
jgi:hypothetical protein